MSNDAGVHGAELAACDFAQVLRVSDASDASEQARLPIVAALHRLLRDAGRVDPGLAGTVATLR